MDKMRKNEKVPSCTDCHLLSSESREEEWHQKQGHRVDDRAIAKKDYSILRT
jgi:hypothetical protein